MGKYKSVTLSNKVRLSVGDQVMVKPHGQEEIIATVSDLDDRGLYVAGGAGFGSFTYDSPDWRTMPVTVIASEPLICCDQCGNGYRIMYRTLTRDFCSQQCVDAYRISEGLPPRDWTKEKKASD